MQESSGTLEELYRRAPPLGLAVRGAFHPHAGEFDELLPGVSAGTIVLLGFTGSVQWTAFKSSPEAKSGIDHPLDRWSRRVIGSLARELGAVDVYPSGASPRLPFQRLAVRCEAMHYSPIGLLIHPAWGLWHAYRGALVLADRVELPGAAPSRAPCLDCAARPCLHACPVRAFREGSFDVEACTGHVRSAAGADCRERGCRARRACPVGASFSYVADQAQFHMRAFLDSTSS